MPSYRYAQSNKYPQGTWNKYRVPPTPQHKKQKKTILTLTMLHNT